MKALLPALLLLSLLRVALARGQGPDDLGQQGKEVFAEHCADCHRLNGEGLPGTFPALNKNPLVLGDPGPLVLTILNGRKGKLGRMPAWRDKLDDREIAAAVTYIRQAWANQAPPVTPAMVAAIRAR